MAYQPFALKYRPQRFEEIVGQPHISQTLQNAVAEGRIVHGYLFAGPRGTGKTSTARVFAKAINCEQGPTPEPCGECDSCVAIQEGRALDVIEVDAAANRRVEDMRQRLEGVAYAPADLRYKVYILDEAHMLTSEANNTFLKTLEEPPAHSYFILCTTEAHKIIPTIMSRCQRFDFRAIPVGLIIEQLRKIAEQEEIEIDEAALRAIAVAATGAMRDGESILDQVIAYAGRDEPIDVGVVRAVLGITEEALLARTAQLVVDGDMAGLFGVVDELVDGGKDVVQFVVDLTEYFRNLLRTAMQAEVPAWAGLEQEAAGQRQQQAAQLGAERVLDIIHRLSQARDQLRYSNQQPLLVEVTLAQLVPVAQVKSAQPSPAAAEPEAAAPPATAPPPQAAPAIAEGLLTLEVVQQHWLRLPVELKRSGNMPIAPIVMAGSPAALDGDKLVLRFDETNQFHYNKTRSQYRDVVEAALQELFGHPLQIECRLGSAPAGDEAEPAAAAAPTVPTGADDTDQAVKRTLQLFEGSREITEE